jgi:hypothetical protein
VKTEAVKTEAVKTEAVKTEAVKTEAVKTEAVKTEGEDPVTRCISAATVCSPTTNHKPQTTIQLSRCAHPRFRSV